MNYLITILIVITLIANFTGKLDNIQFLILIIGLTIMNMILRIEDRLDDIDNKLKKLLAGQKEKEEKR